MEEAEFNPLKILLTVGAIATASAFLVTASHEFSAERIAANRSAQLLASLHSVLGERAGTLDLAPISVEAPESRSIGQNQTFEVFVVLDDDRVAAAIIPAVAAGGYNAAIELLIGISADGGIDGVRVVRHRETPGLGDAIDIEKSSWIEQFNGARLGMPELGRWKTAQEDGDFDSISGASVTSRAVIDGVKNALLYFDTHRQYLFETAIELRRESENDGAD